MPSLKDLRVRIRSVRSTQKITSAMKMVAASRLRRAQEQAEAARPYAAADGAGAGLARRRHGRACRARRRCWPAPARTRCICWSSRPPTAASPAASTPRSCARRGAAIRELDSAGKTVKILTIGRKGRDGLRRDYARLIHRQPDRYRPPPRLVRRGARHRRSASWRCSRPASSTSARSSSTASARR